jgi:hypothetical protein
VSQLDPKGSGYCRANTEAVPVCGSSAMDVKEADPARGFERVRASLLDTRILAITKLLLDGDYTNPPLLTMLGETD